MEKVRKNAIEILTRHKQGHLSDFGWDISTFEALNFAITDMEKVDELEKSVEILKGMTTGLLLKFQEECVQVARDNLLESQVEMLGRVFAAVLLHKEYAEVTKEEISNMLVVEEEDAI